ncbi:MAG: hypothetical protein ACI88A_005066 [Paraglaciecola sp.]|jgi:hypothetical protein
MLLAVKWYQATGKTLKTEQFVSDEFKQFSRSTTFICASAGNHGLTVASGAKMFNAKAKIHFSEEVPENLDNFYSKNRPSLFDQEKYMRTVLLLQLEMPIAAMEFYSPMVLGKAIPIRHS